MKKSFCIYLLFAFLSFGFSTTANSNDMLKDGVVHLNSSSNIFKNKNALIYPNPSSITTTIFYTPEKNETISIKLYTDKGFFIDELYNEKVIVGRLYEFELNSEEMASGIYFCVIQSDHTIINKRVEIIH